MGILSQVPSIVEVQFDGYPSVQRDGGMMTALLEVVGRYNKLVSWGPERGWREEVDVVRHGLLLTAGEENPLLRSIAVLA